MFRVDTTTATDSLPAPDPAGRPGYFQSGNPQTGIPATVPGADWFNMVQEEMASLVEHYGLTLNKTDRTQMRQAIEAAISDQASELPAGSIITSGSQVAPDGYLLCNGATVSRRVYADLFTAIGTSFGAGDGSNTFNIPDLRGEFLRGWDNGRGIDGGRAFGSAQSGLIEAHSHNDPLVFNPRVKAGAAFGNGLSMNETAVRHEGEINGNSPDGDEIHPLTSSEGGTETRPRNIAVNFYIKY